MQADLAVEGARIDAFYICPFHAERRRRRRTPTPNHPDRKPNPGMLLQGHRRTGPSIPRRCLLVGRQAERPRSGQAGRGFAGVLLRRRKPGRLSRRRSSLRETKGYAGLSRRGRPAQRPKGRAPCCPSSTSPPNRRESSPLIDQAIARVLAHGAYVMGPEVSRASRRRSRRASAKPGSPSPAPTAPTHIALPLMAWEIGAGDAVFCPSASPSPRPAKLFRGPARRRCSSTS